MKNPMTNKRPDGFDLSYEQMLAAAAKPQQLIVRPGSAYAESQRKFQGIPSITVAPGGGCGRSGFPVVRAKVR